MWRKGENLIVRGKIAFIGRNQTWLPYQDEDLSKEAKPLVPTLPRLDRRIASAVFQRFEFESEPAEVFRQSVGVVG